MPEYSDTEKVWISRRNAKVLGERLAAADLALEGMREVATELWSLGFDIPGSDIYYRNHTANLETGVNALHAALKGAIGKFHSVADWLDNNNREVPGLL